MLKKIRLKTLLLLPPISDDASNAEMLIGLVKMVGWLAKTAKATSSTAAAGVDETIAALMMTAASAAAAGAEALSTLPIAAASGSTPIGLRLNTRTHCSKGLHCSGADNNNNGNWDQSMQRASQERERERERVKESEKGSEFSAV